MNRLNEQQAKKILFEAQCAGYPNKNIPELFAPLYGHIEQIESQLAEAQAELNETYVDDKETVWNRPTAEAYYRGCKARDKWQYQAEQAQADNAILVKAHQEIEYLTNNRDEQIKKFMYGSMACNWEQADYMVGKGISDWEQVFKEPHPGSALLKELNQLRQMETVAQKLKDSYGKDAQTKMQAWHEFINAMTKTYETGWEKKPMTPGPGLTVLDQAKEGDA